MQKQIPDSEAIRTRITPVLITALEHATKLYLDGERKPTNVTIKTNDCVINCAISVKGR